MDLEPSYLTWGLLGPLLILNILIFFHDPYKYSNSQNCLELPCRPYSLTTALFTLFLDLCLAASLTHINPLPFLPTFWYIPFGIIAIMIILLHFNESNVVVKDKRFNPPPEYFFKKPVRMVIRGVITILYLLIITARLSSETIPTLKLETLPFSHRFLYNRFGGLNANNMVPFFLSWLSILALPIAIIRLYQTIKYHPSDYNQPLPWNK